MENNNTNRKKIRFLPIIVLILFYLNTFSSALEVAQAQNDISYIILAFTVTLPFFVPIIIAAIFLIKK